MFSTDLPIDKIEDDLLGRGDFARKIAQAIKYYRNPECLTIGIYGDWGSGKTSLANMILNEISETGKENIDIKYCLIKFNPWLFSNQNDLIIQLFTSISEVFKFPNTPGIKEKSANIVSHLGRASEFIGHFPIPIVGKIAKEVSAIFKDYSKLLKGEKTKKNENETLTLLKNKINKTLNDNKIKLIISIDDFDRLSQDEIRLMFQVVKVLGDFNNTVYILLLDKDVVIDSLKNVQGGNGEHYLKKIIQVPISLPPIRTDVLQKLIFDNFRSIIKYDSLSDNDKQFLDYNTRKLSNTLSPHIKNIRDINRVINLFEFKYGFIKDEVNPLHLLALSVIEVSENALYNEIMENKYDLGKVKNDLEIYKFLTSKATSSWNKFNNPRFNNYFGRKEYLDMYFSLELPAQYISSLERENIIFKFDIPTIRIIINGHVDDIPLLLDSIQSNLTKLNSERRSIAFQTIVFCFLKKDVSYLVKIETIAFKLISLMNKKDIESLFYDFKTNDERKKLIFLYTDILIYLKKEKCEQLKKIFINAINPFQIDDAPDFDISQIEKYYISALYDINIFDYKNLELEKLYELCKEVDINFLKKWIPADFKSLSIWVVLYYEINLKEDIIKGVQYSNYYINIDVIKKLADIDKLKEFLKSRDNYPAEIFSIPEEKYELSRRIMAFLCYDPAKTIENGIFKVDYDKNIAGNSLESFFTENELPF